jgi:hypothetical protein
VLSLGDALPFIQGAMAEPLSWLPSRIDRADSPATSVASSAAAPRPFDVFSWRKWRAPPRRAQRAGGAAPPHRLSLVPISGGPAAEDLPPGRRIFSGTEAPTSSSNAPARPGPAQAGGGRGKSGVTVLLFGVRPSARGSTLAVRQL